MHCSPISLLHLHLLYIICVQYSVFIYFLFTISFLILSIFTFISITIAIIISYILNYWFAENAESFKDDGNHNFKFKKYRWAIDNYTAGIKQMSADKELNAILYTNRAAANFRIGNHSLYMYRKLELDVPINTKKHNKKKHSL